MNRQEQIITYSCASDVGLIRSKNQDNLVCDGIYMNNDKQTGRFSLAGRTPRKGFHLFGVFDGMGGEQCGEVASCLAAADAAQFQLQGDVACDLKNLCLQTNRRICRYAEENEIFSMGTTAAMLGFTEDALILCNIGDSKVFRYNGTNLKQLSVDHLAYVPAGRKPALSQNLGIPEDLMIIEPFVEAMEESDDEVYIICSDGLTDMVSLAEMWQIIAESKIPDLAGKLVAQALKNGGKDNVTVIAVKAEREE